MVQVGAEGCVDNDGTIELRPVRVCMLACCEGVCKFVPGVAGVASDVLGIQGAVVSGRCGQEGHCGCQLDVAAESAFAIYGLLDLCIVVSNGDGCDSWQHEGQPCGKSCCCELGSVVRAACLSAGSTYQPRGAIKQAGSEDHAPTSRI